MTKTTTTMKKRLQSPIEINSVIFSVHIFHQCFYNENANLLLINDFPILCVHFFKKKIGFWLVDLCICLSVFQTFGRLFWHKVDSFRTQNNSLKNELFLPLLLPVIRYHVLIHSLFSLPEIFTLRYGHNINFTFLTHL